MTWHYTNSSSFLKPAEHWAGINPELAFWMLEPACISSNQISTRYPDGLFLTDVLLNEKGLHSKQNSEGHTGNIKKINDNILTWG